jgi:hypothetical protein
VSSRFLRHFTALCVPPPSDDAAKAIFTAILGGFLAAVSGPPGLHGLLLLLLLLLRLGRRRGRRLAMIAGTCPLTCIPACSCTGAQLPGLLPRAMHGSCPPPPTAAALPPPQDGFSAEVRALCGPLVAASIEAYGRACAELLPTPSKAHYTFNLRDLSKVVQGLTSVTPACCAGREQLARLWLHECCRVFHDRLVSGGSSQLLRAA